MSTEKRTPRPKCGFTSKAEEATTFEVNRIKYTVTGENSVGVSGLNENYEPGEVKLTEVIIPSTVIFFIIIQII